MSGKTPAPPGRDKFDAWFDDANAERDRLTERVAELVTEVNDLRAEVAEILSKFRPANPAEPHGRYAAVETAAMIEHWRIRARLLPAAVTAGTEHLAAKIRGLAIGDEED